MTMQRIVPSIVLVVVLLACSIGFLRAQGGGTPAVSTARAANAPPLVPVRLNADGNFRIAPPYVADPAFTAKPDVPKGRVIRFTMNSAESKIFPTDSREAYPADRSSAALAGSGWAAHDRVRHCV
jgi:hypothetical protein